jgi:hypothetical protein
VRERERERGREIRAHLNQEEATTTATVVKEEVVEDQVTSRNKLNFLKRKGNKMKLKQS